MIITIKVKKERRTATTHAGKIEHNVIMIEAIKDIYLILQNKGIKHVMRKIAQAK